MNGWGVVNETAVIEGVYPTVTEAIRTARKSGEPVWLHADDCTTDDKDPEFGGECPCRPVNVSGAD